MRTVTVKIAFDTGMLDQADVVLMDNGVRVDKIEYDTVSKEYGVYTVVGLIVVQANYSLEFFEIKT